MRQIVNSTQLDRWFSSASRDAQELLPHLIRWLIVSTVPRESLKLLGVAAGDEVRRHGYDGQVHSAGTHPFVPEGVSVWEMGTGDPARKFAEDYNHRIADPRGVTPQSTTFVFVTPHSWEGKSSKEAEKRNEGKWKNVRILDSSDLEAWLEFSPPVARWIADQMGVPVNGLDDVRTYWKLLEAKYRSPVPAQLVVGGRSDAALAVTNWLMGAEPAITVQGESVEEAAAFACAVIETLGEDERDRAIASTVVAYEPAAIDYLAASPIPLIVIPVGTDATRRARAKASKTLRVIEPAERRSGTNPSEGDVIKPGMVRRQAIEDALKSKLGFSAARAERVAKECKGSLWAVLVMLSSGPDEPLPWASGLNARKLACLALAAQWVPTHPDDREAVAKLSGVTPGELDDLIAAWTGNAGPLVMRRGICDWLGWDFAWKLLAPAFDRPLIDRFAELLWHVLLKPDPRIDLKPDQRWQAGILGKQHPYSGALRSGLIGSIVQFALNDTEIPSGDGQALANFFVRTLLNGEKLNRGVAWFTLAAWLPDLAEASPSSFLDCAEALASDPAAVGTLFAEGGSFGFSPHTHLLWALERLAWSPTFLSRAVVLLGKFAAVDPGGKLGNRPVNSLHEILVPWHPSTTGTVQQRLDAIVALQQANAGIAWKLAVSLMPHMHQIVRTTDKPRWRLWLNVDEVSVTVSDYWDFLEPLVRRMLNWAGPDASRWLELLKLYDDLWPVHVELAKELLASLLSEPFDAWSDADKASISNESREILNKHRAYPNAKWVIPEEALAPLTELSARAQPQDLVNRHAWLFSVRVSLPLRADASIEEREKTVWELRDAAAKQILDANGICGLLKLASAAGHPTFVGTAMARMGMTPEMEIELFRTTLAAPGDSGVAKEDDACRGYAWTKYVAEGIGWLDRVSSSPEIGWSGKTLAELAMALPASGDVWDRLESWGEEPAGLYWQRTSVSYVYRREVELPRAIEKLIHAKRPYHAINLIGMHLYGPAEAAKLPLAPENLVQLLKDAVQHNPKAEAGTFDVSMLSHHVSEILDRLEAEGVGADILAGIEWSWMAALEHTPRGTKALRAVVTQEPEFFVQLLELAFRGEGDPPRELTGGEKQAARQASLFLGEIKRVPGLINVTATKNAEGDVTFSPGEVEEEMLSRWVNAVRERAAAARRLRVCDSVVGDMLAYAPADGDGAWPCIPVRNLIETLASDELDDAIRVGVRNKRGVHFVEPGGQQEIRLAKKFQGYADAVRSRWPRTGQILDKLADIYEHEAKENIDRERFEEFE